MKDHYIVCTADGFRSTAVAKERDGEHEKFATFHAAEKRAQALALETPGQDVHVYEAIAVINAPVGTPETQNKARA